MKTLQYCLIWLFALLWLPVSAINILTGESVTIRERQEGNVYIGAGNVSIEAPVYGNVTCAGGRVQLLDTLAQDLILVGGKAELRGRVLGDLRTAGGQLYLYGQVSGDVVAAGGEIEIGPDAVITGDLIVLGGIVRMQGRVQGDLVLAGGTLRFTGLAERETELRGGTIYFDGTANGPAVLAAEELELGPAASFLGPVRYWRDKGELDFGPYLRAGQVARFDPTLEGDHRQQQTNWARRAISGFLVFRLLAGSLAIVLLVWLFGSFFRRASAPVRTNWLAKFGSGVLFFLGVPIAVVLALMTVIGIPVGLFALFLYGFSLMFAYALTAVVAACAWENYRNLHWTRGQLMLAAIGVFFLLKLIGWIPLLGWLISIVAVSIAFGAIVQALLRKKVPAGV